MRTSHFFSQLLRSVLFLPAFLSAELIDLENEGERNGVHTQNNLEMSTFRHCSDDSGHHKHGGTVFASYRNDQDITIPAGGKVLFNVKNANKGDGIFYHEDGIFTIRKSGFYLINYGLASIGNAGTAGEAFGFNLIRIRKGNQDIVDSVLTDSSSAIVLFLRENDRIAVVSQRFQVTLVAGNLPPRTTSLTDTAYISFLKVDR